jgi:hypothetical protein
VILSEDGARMPPVFPIFPMPRQPSHLLFGAPITILPPDSQHREAGEVSGVILSEDGACMRPIFPLTLHALSAFPHASVSSN